MSSKIITALLLSVLFFSVMFGITIIFIDFPVDFSGDPIGSGHPYVTPTSSSYLCGDPIGSGHPCSNQTA